MGLAETVYVPLMEQKDTRRRGWSKRSLDYALAHEKTLMSHIRSIARKLMKRNIQKADAEDIFSELMIYLHDNADYDAETGIERTGRIVTIEGYMYSCTKFCVIRYVTDKYKEDKNLAQETLIYTDNDDAELSVFDIKRDETVDREYEMILLDIEEWCKQNISARYQGNVDIYLVMYLKLLTEEMKQSGHPDKFEQILLANGISKKDVEELMQYTGNDNYLGEMAKVVTACGSEKSLVALSKYVYGANIIAQLARAI